MIQYTRTYQAMSTAARQAQNLSEMHSAANLAGAFAHVAASYAFMLLPSLREDEGRSQA